MISSLPATDSARPAALADHNGWIDSLRATAAVAVAFFHLNLLVPVPAGAPAAAFWRAACLYGYLGVPVFFVISGYCIGTTWLRSPGPLDFVRRRARRILPAYWASLAVVAALAVAFKLFRGINDVAALPATPAAVVATLALLTDPATPVKNINWVYWSLVTEVFFYAVCALLLLAPAAGPARAWRLAAVHGLFCALSLAPGLPRTGAFFFIYFWPMFGLGAILAVRRVHSAAAAAMLTASSLHLLGRFLRPGHDQGFFLAAAATTAALAALLPFRFPAALRPLAWFGGLSYSLYLIHVPIGLYLILRFLPAAPATTGTYFALQLFWGFMVGFAAWLFWRAFERPFLRSTSR